MEFLAVVAIGLLALLAFGGAAVLFRRQDTGTICEEDRAVIRTKWTEIETKAKKGGPTNFRQAIIDADKLLDFAMQQLEVSGDTMGDRLRACQDRYSNLNDVWSAHKVRNQIVHELDREILSFEAEKVLAKFKRALQDLGGL